MFRALCVCVYNRNVVNISVCMSTVLCTDMHIHRSYAHTPIGVCTHGYCCLLVL